MRGLGPQLAYEVCAPEEHVGALVGLPLIIRARQPQQAAVAMTNKGAVEAHAREELGLNVHSLSNPLKAAFAGACCEPSPPATAGMIWCLSPEEPSCRT